MNRKRNTSRKISPQRMRDYRIEAQLRESPDLHKLAQVVIDLAIQQAKAERDTQKLKQPDIRRSPDDPVES